MNILILSLSILAIFSPLISTLRNKNFKKICVYIFFLLVIFGFGLRSIKSPDTEAYQFIFYNIYSEEEIIQRLELLYKIFIKINLQILKEFRVYLILLTFGFFIFWEKITKYFVKDISAIFGTFYLTYGIYFFGITQRQSLAFLVSYMGLKQIIIDKKNIRGMILIILSSLIHSSMLMYLVVIFLCKKKIKVFYLEILVFCSLIFSIFFMENSIMMNLLQHVLELLKLNHYKAYLSFNYGVSLNTLYQTALAIIFLEYRKKVKLNKEIYNFFLNLYITGVLILNFFKFFKGVNRLADIFLVFFPIILGIVFLNMKERKDRVLMILVTIINNLLLFFISVKNLHSFYIN